MAVMPQMRPISDLRYKLSEVIGSLTNGPVLLAQRSKPAGVLVSVEEWNKKEKRIAELEWREEVRQASREVAEGEVNLSYDEFMSELYTYHERI